MQRMEEFFRDYYRTSSKTVFAGLAAVVAAGVLITLGYAENRNEIISGVVKETIKTGIIQRADAIGDPDCIAVAGMMEEDYTLAFKDGNALKFAAAMVSDGTPSCMSVIDGYLPPSVASSSIVAIDVGGPTTTPVEEADAAIEDEEANQAEPSHLQPEDTTAREGLAGRQASSQPALPTRTWEADNEARQDESVEDFSSDLQRAETEEQEVPEQEVPELTYEVLPEAVIESAGNVYNYGSAQRFISRHLRFKYLIPEIVTNPTTQVRYIYYKLPQEIAANEYILEVLGQPLPTRAGERLPPRVFAIVPHFPEGMVAKLGPHVWTNLDGVSELEYGRSMEAMYGAQEYPPQLFSEIFLQYKQQDRFSPFRGTDRVGPFVGTELRRGWIESGSIYLCTDAQGGWRLYEYPYLPQTGDCARMLWNWNPQLENGREFNPSPGTLVYQQNVQLNLTIQERSAGRPLQDNVGPSVLFRTDTDTGESDFILFPAYVYLNNPSILANLAFGAPLPSGRMPDPDKMILASPDLHFAYANGAGTGAGLEGPDGARNPKIIIPAEGGIPLEALGNYANSISFYIGLDELPEPDLDVTGPAMPR